MHSADLLQTPLEEVHRGLGAKIGPFAGWAMPIEYEGTVSEHRAVRERVGLFDLSHLGKVDVTGPGALPLLQQTMTNDHSKLRIGGALYNLILNDHGGVEEDLIAYRLAPDRFFVVPNASNTAKVVAILRQSASDVDVVDHPGWCFLGVQGPRSPEVVGALFPEAAPLPFMGCTEAKYRGSRSRSSRAASGPATSSDSRWAIRCTGKTCSPSARRSRPAFRGRSRSKRDRFADVMRWRSRSGRASARGCAGW